MAKDRFYFLHIENVENTDDYNIAFVDKNGTPDEVKGARKVPANQQLDIPIGCKCKIKCDTGYGGLTVLELDTRSDGKLAIKLPLRDTQKEVCIRWNCVSKPKPAGKTRKTPDALPFRLYRLEVMKGKNSADKKSQRRLILNVRVTRPGW